MSFIECVNLAEGRRAMSGEEMLRNSWAEQGLPTDRWRTAAQAATEAAQPEPHRHPTLTVGRLRELLAELSDDVYIRLDGCDCEADCIGIVDEGRSVLLVRDDHPHYLEES